ncbi:MAG: nucleotidyltransferase domain-containing protein, partial [Candidatus Nanoarchaeia archaeon]|nr:nucleotidyltransferase domain-containing protein [Candidatus Jingweiarchaeum tengchongense]
MKEKIESLADIKRRIGGKKELSEKDLEVKKEELELINNFCSKLVENFGGYIHAVIVFGSFATEEMKEKSDIDVLVLVDDLLVPATSDVVGAFRVGLAKILAELNAVDKLHVNTLGIKEFWDGVRNADPVIVDTLRKGFAVVDTGFFDPLKRLLIEGRIRPTQESIEAHIKRA